MKAIYNGVTVAKSDHTVMVEGNHYFPPESVDRQYLQRSRMKSLCYWKGIASYHHLHVGDAIAKRAAWVYRHPSPLARRIKNHIAFDGSVNILED